jgi:7-cyano-7-deazaguanine synthase
MKKIVLSLSGGSDSTILLHKAAKEKYNEIHTISFDYGQRHCQELDCIDYQIKDIYKKYKINVIHTTQDVRFIKHIANTSSITNDAIDTPDIRKIAGEAQPKSYVPYRNLIFISICAAYAESRKIETIWHGAAGDDSLAGYWDGDISFFAALQNVISLNRMFKVNIEAPLLKMSKKEILKEGIELGVNFAKTWTCYSNNANGLADATTPSSSLRLKAFIDCGYRDPIQYIQQDKLNIIYDQNNCKYL